MSGPRPAFSPTIALLTATRIWETLLTDSLKPLGLTTRKYGLLGHIRGMPGISFSELARRSRITVQSAHSAVAAFVSAGLVGDDTAHAGTASKLRVTADGEALLRQAAAVVAQLDAAFEERHPDLSATLRREMERTLS